MGIPLLAKGGIKLGARVGGALGLGAMYTGDRRRAREHASEEQRRLEEREDSAIQRAVLDAQKAGLSPHALSGGVKSAPTGNKVNEESDPLMALAMLGLIMLRRSK